MKVTPQMLQQMKRRGEKIAALTAYDFLTAKLLDEAGLPLILVGDSLGMVVLGYENTLPVTMEEMLHHVKAVARARPRALLVGDMPYKTYETPEAAVVSARRFVEAGADAVKLEGGETVLAQVRAVIAAGIPVLGHIGLLPQSLEKLGGYKVQGKTPESAEQLLRDARALEEVGVFAIVLECIVAAVAKRITESIAVPTIGIGAGPHCDGQILVVHDLLGMYPRIPRHTKVYAQLAAAMREAFAAYKRDVEDGKFPGPEQSFS
ncbi:MAG: 3-methyl-2-oxobutanoate hydroxymethyltransferase [Verrucomicrobiae bacterium]|nr:3-methyl-2-oxobutanoate hydroxymethyltransferase [Verrucomicrobiae bacterium]